MRCTCSNASSRAATSATMATNPSTVNAAAPNRSDRPTTPTGMDCVPISSGGWPGVEPHPDQFGGPAADVEQQRPPAVPGQQRRAAFQRELRLLPGGDHVQLQAGLPRHPRDERVRVGRRAGTPRWRWRARRHRPRRQAVGAGLQGIDGTVHRRRAELAGLLQALAQPHDPAEAVEHAEAPAGRRAHEQPAVVGPEVERGVGPATGRLRAVDACMTASVSLVQRIGKRLPAPGHCLAGAGWYRPRRCWGIV